MTKIPEEYTNPELVWIYDFEYDYTYDIPFYKECANLFGSPVLELASGTGRVTIPLAEAGSEVWALEASKLMIKRFRDKLRSKNPSLSENIRLICGDMAGFELKKRFPIIIISANSFLLLDRKGQKQCLEACNRHLSDEGAVVIDIFHPFGPSRAFHRIDQTEGIPKLTRTRPQPDSGKPVSRYVIQFRDFFEQHLFIDNIYEEEGDEGRKWSFREKLRFIYPSEMELMLELAGLEIHKVFGWYDGRSFAPDSEQMIFVARRSSRREE